MHTVFALLCFVVVIHWLIFPYPSGLLHWHCGNLTIAPVPAKQPWWIWINTSCEFIMNDYITTTKQIKTKPYAYFLGYTVALWTRAQQNFIYHFSLLTPYCLTCFIIWNIWMPIEFTLHLHTPRILIQKIRFCYTSGCDNTQISNRNIHWNYNTSNRKYTNYWRTWHFTC